MVKGSVPVYEFPVPVLGDWILSYTLLNSDLKNDMKQGKGRRKLIKVSTAVVACFL